MRLLFLVTEYPPFGGAEGIIVNNLVSELKKRHQIVILTSRPFTDKQLEEDKNLVFYYFDCHKTISFIDCFKKKTQLLPKVLNWFNRKLNPFYFYSNIIVENIKKNIYMLSSEVFDATISVSGNIETTIALSKCINPNLGKLFFYQLDPLTNSTNFKRLSHKKRMSLEKRLSSPPFNVITTNYLLEQKRKNGIDVDNVKLAEFPSLKPYLYNEHYKPNERPLAVFVGNLYKKLREPFFTIDILKDSIFADVDFVFIGNGFNKFLKRLTTVHKNFIYYGPLPYDMTFDFIKKADFLINIGNKDISYFPSKILEYVSTGKPIINFAQSQNCPTISFLKEYNNSISVVKSSNMEENKAQIKSFILEKKGCLIAKEELTKKFFNYSIDFFSKNIESILLKDCLFKNE